MALPVPSIVYWPQQPMVRILILFFAGILPGEFYPLPAGMQIAAAWVFLFIIFLNIRNKKRIAKVQRLLSGLSISILVILSGSISSTLRNPFTRQNNISTCDLNKSTAFLVKILPEPVYKNNSLKFNAEIIAVFSRKSLRRIRGAFRIIIRDFKDTGLKTGDELWVYGKAVCADDAFLPGTFSMKNWMSQDGISHIITISPTQLKKTNISSNAIQRLAIDWRKNLIKKLALNGLQNKELAVASALILGERSEIDRDVLSDYSSSGIVHILAVSGLHVGLIYAGLLLFLGKIRSLKNSWTGALICVIALWLYAMMTGLSASVLRAGVMYSFIAVSSVRKVSLSPFNALAASAFILLAFNPWIWKNTGFQLSYAAVWGIISFQKKLSNLLFTPNRFFRYVIQSISISLSAQVTTSPLTFYLFGSFPVYFLFANLIAIPVSTLLTYTGIAAIAFSWVPYLGEFLAWCLGAGIQILNGFANFVSSLPNASAGNLFISFTCMLLSMTFLIQLSLLLQHFNARRLISALAVLLILSGQSVHYQLGSKRGNLLMLFGRSGNLHCIHVHYSQASHYIIGNKEISSQTENDSQVFLRKTFGIHSPERRFRVAVNKCKSEPHLFEIRGQLILFLDKHVIVNQLPSDRQVIIVVARKSNQADLQLVNKIRPRFIITSPEVTKKEIKAWREIAESSGIAFIGFSNRMKFQTDIY